MHRVKLFFILGLSLLALIVLLQNTEPVVTKILFVTITMPRAVLLFGTMMIGFALGVLVSFVMMKRREADTR